MVTIHPSSSGVNNAPVLVALSRGTVELWILGGGNARLELVTCLASKATLSSGWMHPNGLIYITETADGSLVV